MAHSHDTHGDSYYLDQLCLVGISAAFAAICLTLYFWQTSMLKLLLAPQFHEFVLYSGILLMILVVVRAAVLWRSFARGDKMNACSHDHGHDHGHHHHDHDHGHCQHDHDHPH